MYSFVLNIVHIANYADPFIQTSYGQVYYPSQKIYGQVHYPLQKNTMDVITEKPWTGPIYILENLWAGQMLIKQKLWAGPLNKKITMDRSITYHTETVLPLKNHGQVLYTP